MTVSLGKWLLAPWAFLQKILGRLPASAPAWAAVPAGDAAPSGASVQPGSEPQDTGIALAAALLTRVRDGLSGHSQQLAIFASSLSPEENRVPAGPRANMQEANRSLEELVERTVGRLRNSSGGLLEPEQTRLADYRRKTSAFDKQLDGISSELVLTHALAELLEIVGNLRDENEAVRDEIAEGQKKLSQLAARVSSVERDARIDPLTQLLNRRAFDEVHAACHAARGEQPYCLMMLDADHFKGINDRYGHPAGDAVLALIGRIIRENCKASDHFARWGGEEFVILIPDCVEEVALVVAERLRRKIEATVLYYGQYTIRVTVSCGIAKTQPGQGPEQVLAQADSALYAAKGEGRNRSCIYRSEGVVPEPAPAATAIYREFSHES